jgi:hypothetical protein
VVRACVCVRVRARARVCVCVCDAGADCLSISTHEERRKAGDRRPAVSLDTALICSVEQQVVDATVARPERLSAFDYCKRNGNHLLQINTTMQNDLGSNGDRA